MWLAGRGLSVLATDASGAMLAVAQAKVRQAGVTDRVRFAQMDASRMALRGLGGSRAFEQADGRVVHQERRALASLHQESTPVTVGSSTAEPTPWTPGAASTELGVGRVRSASVPDHGPPRAPSGVFSGVFDAALADFGVLNCVADRRGLAQALADRLRPGAALVAVVMGPLCVWEVVWHLAHADLAGGVRRWRSGALARVGTACLPVWYPSPSRLRAELAPRFGLRRLVGLGTLLPPSHLGHLVDRWPGLFTRLAAIEPRVPFGPWLADHYLAVFERR